MTTQDQAKAALLSSQALTLGALRDRILADETLSGSRRRDMASALSVIAKVIGQPAELIPANPVALRSLLGQRTAAMAGMATGTWKNVLSLLTAALAYAGSVSVQGRIRKKPSAAWQEVLDLTAENSGQRWHLTRFARYCSTAGAVEPQQVNDAVIATYQADLESRSMVSDPKRSAREVARTWNAAAASHPGWPQQVLTVPDNRNTFTLEWGAYPETLKQDVDRLMEWLQEDDPFNGRTCQPLRPASIQTRTKQMRLLVGALVQTGVDAISLTDLRAVVTVDRMEAALRFFFEKAGSQPTSHVHQLAGLAVMLAQHWVKLSGSEVTEIKGFRNRLKPSATGISDRNVIRLRAMDQPSKRDSLSALPGRLTKLAGTADTPTIKTALLVQTAVMIAVLRASPVRMANLQGIRIGTHLISGSSDEMYLVHSREEVKNGALLEALIPERVAKLIALYIKDYRPLLARSGGDWLFPSLDPTRPKSSMAIRSQITKAMAVHCGLEWHPHLFRHLTALIVLKDDPRAHGTVQRLLGHHSLHTVLAAYSGLETRIAYEHYHKLLDIEDETPSDPPKKPKPPRGAK